MREVFFLDRVLSDEQKLRKAIEISQRRNNYYKSTYVRPENNEINKKEYKLFKRMFIQIVICLFIYGGFYIISNRNNIFSSNIIEKTNLILSYDVNFKEWCEKGKNSVNGFINKWREQNIVNNDEKNNNPNSTQTENVSEANQEIENNNAVEEQNNQPNEEKKVEDSQKNLSKMKKDVEFIKSNYSFKRPIKGKITSRFGEREVLIKGMTSNHKGIDIATKNGTKIRASIDGQVEEASKNSQYGNFIKIKKDDILTVYAHCKKLKVKKGDTVKKGDVIATVGSTGVATGPHLHFEIRLNNRYINPELIIQF